MDCIEVESAMVGVPGFTVGGALRLTYRLMRRRGGSLLGLAVAFLVLPILAFALIPRSLVEASAGARLGPPGPAPLDPAALSVVWLANTGVQVVGALLVLMSAAWLADQGHRGRPAPFGASADAALRALPAGVAVMVLASLGMLAGFLLVVPGVMLAARWAVAYQALVVERPGVLGALGRSRILTSGHRWAVIGFSLVIALADVLIVVAGFALAVAAACATGAAPAAAAVLIAVGAAVAVLNGAAYAALYTELRRARGGYDPAGPVAGLA